MASNMCVMQASVANMSRNLQMAFHWPSPLFLIDQQKIREWMRAKPVSGTFRLKRIRLRSTWIHGDWIEERKEDELTIFILKLEARHWAMWTGVSFLRYIFVLRKRLDSSLCRLDLWKHLQCHFCCVFPGIMEILAIVPASSRYRLARDDDSTRPSRAATWSLSLAAMQRNEPSPAYLVYLNMFRKQVG